MNSGHILDIFRVVYIEGKYSQAFAVALKLN